MFNTLKIALTIVLLTTCLFSYGTPSNTLKMLNNADNYQIIAGDTELVVTVSSGDLAAGHLTMKIERHAVANLYTFSGKINFVVDPLYSAIEQDKAELVSFNYPFRVENGQLILPEQIDVQNSTIHQALFAKLMTIITTQQTRYGDLYYAAWVPLVTDLSLAITEVNINHVEKCQDPNYKLTPEQVMQYFLLSTEYTYIDPYLVNDYDTYGCNISGTLRNHHQLVDFSIDMGGLGYLDHRRFGCAKGRCNAFGLGTDGQLASE